MRLYLAWVVAFLGTLLSLYVEEGLHEEPCFLCWYQRMALFPLTLLLGIALFRGDNQISFYGKALAGAGFLVSLYHLLGLWTAHWNLWLSCSENCFDQIYKLFGWIPFPYLSAMGFLWIFFILPSSLKNR